MIHAYIHNLQVESMLTTEHIHPSPSMREVHHLLPGNLTRRHTDTLALDTMVCTQQQMTGVCQTGRERLLYQTDLHGQFL